MNKYFQVNWLTIKRVFAVSFNYKSSVVLKRFICMEQILVLQMLFPFALKWKIGSKMSLHIECKLLYSQKISLFSLR